MDHQACWDRHKLRTDSCVDTVDCRGGSGRRDVDGTLSGVLERCGCGTPLPPPWRVLAAVGAVGGLIARCLPGSPAVHTELQGMAPVSCSAKGDASSPAQMYPL